MAIPTTDEMDHTTPEDRYKLVAECSSCGHWQHFTGSAENVGNQTKGVKCDNCGGHSFRTGSLISQRTFNPLAAKRKGRTSRR